MPIRAEHRPGHPSGPARVTNSTRKLRAGPKCWRAWPVKLSPFFALSLPLYWITDKIINNTPIQFNWGVQDFQFNSPTFNSSVSMLNTSVTITTSNKSVISNLDVYFYPISLQTVSMLSSMQLFYLAFPIVFVRDMVFYLVIILMHF
jgi:hypothetical protein